MIVDACEKAMAILRNTHDGDDLTGVELWVVQEAVNDRLNPKGWDKFEEIYEAYEKPGKY